MTYKILVTPRSFGKHSQRPMQLLKEKGFHVKKNPYGKILTEDQMIEQVKDVDGVIIGVDPLNQKVLQHANKLKAISKYGVGLDNIDLDYTKKHNIAVSIASDTNTDAVADYTFALMMAAARRVAHIDKECRKLNWEKITTIDISNKTLGLIGLGNIGKKVSRRAQGFDMEVLAYDLNPDYEYSRNNGISYVDSLEEILKKSDFISLHLPLNAHTNHIIGSHQFDIMKSNSVIVNTARGGLIDEQALFNALQYNKIWGAGIDVFESEPPKNTEMLNMENIVVGSHCAASTVEAIDNMGITASKNIIGNLLR